MKKRGQVTIFLILAVVLLLLCFGIIFYFSKEGFKPITQKQVSLTAEVQSFTAMRDNCLEKKFLEAKNLFGVNDDSSTPLKYEAFLQGEFHKCMDLDAFKNRGIKVTTADFHSNVAISKFAIIINANYPVTLEVGGQQESLSTFSYRWNKERNMLISLDASGKTTDAAAFTSTDKKIQLTIPKGTKITKNGQPVTTLDVNVIDKYFNNMANPLIVGSTAYDFPDGIEFSPYATITLNYETKDIPPYMDEKELKVMYYDSRLKTWIAWPSTVDTVKNQVSAKITHFSNDLAPGFCPSASEINMPQTLYFSGNNKEGLVIKFQPQGEGEGCSALQDENNLRVRWYCSKECNNVKIEGQSVVNDEPLKVDFKSGENKLTFDLINPDTGNPKYNFEVTLYSGVGFYPNCIKDNKTKEFSVNESCLCGKNTIDLNASAYNKDSEVTCCANSELICGGGCQLADCSSGVALAKENEGCVCGDIVYQPTLFPDGKNYCCADPKNCTEAACEAIMGGAVEGCYCRNDSNICPADMQCGNEHCCPTNSTWNETQGKCAEVQGPGPVDHCFNTVQDDDETGVNCGGSCPACAGPEKKPNIIDIVIE